MSALSAGCQRSTRRSGNSTAAWRRARAVLSDPGVTVVELLPVHAFLHEQSPSIAGCETSGVTRPSSRHAAYAADQAVRSASSRRWSAVAPRRPRGDPRRRLQPHGRRQSCGPTPSLKGFDNRRITGCLTMIRRGLRLHRHREHAEPPPSPDAASVMDSLRYWVEMHVDGSVRPGVALAAPRRLRSARTVLRGHRRIRPRQVKLMPSPGTPGRRLPARRFRADGPSGTIATATPCDFWRRPRAACRIRHARGRQPRWLR